jgi:uncharacterized membrane protein YedE/YeeE
MVGLELAASNHPNEAREAEITMTRNSTFGVPTGGVAIVAAFALLLAVSVALVFAMLRIADISGFANHAAAAGAELIFGCGALLAAVFIATRIAVRAFANRDAKTLPRTASNSRSSPEIN